MRPEDDPHQRPPLDPQEIARRFDRALDSQNLDELERTFGELHYWAWKQIVLPKVKDWDDAYDLATEMIMVVYRRTQTKEMTGAHIVNLARSVLEGSTSMKQKRIPGLIEKYQAESFRRGRLEISLSDPVAGGRDVGEDSDLTVGDTIANPGPTPEEVVEEQSRQDLHLATAYTQIADWEKRIPEIGDTTKQETLSALLTHIKRLRSTVTMDQDNDFRIPLLHFTAVWTTRPEVCQWFKEELKLKHDASVTKRLLRVADLWRPWALDQKTPHTRAHLEAAVARLRYEAKMSLWDHHTDRQTVKAICDWVEFYLDEILTALPPLLIQKQQKFMLDPDVSRFLQGALNLNQNAVRQRVNRVLDILVGWRFLETIRDE